MRRCGKRRLNFNVVIPARFASERLPGKPLITLAGKPMIRHVWERARLSGARSVIVATDDERIADACRSFDAEVCITRSDHSSGTDRIEEVAAKRNWDGEALVVNLQGDEPLMPSTNIAQVAELLHINDYADMATLFTPLRSDAEFHDPSVVKLVHDKRGRALYFSRAPIPSVRGASGGKPAGALRHLGLYAYRVRTLRRLAGTPPCDLETAERLEQLRALWLGLIIQVDAATEVPGPGVDTQEDAEKASDLLAKMLL